MDKSNRASRNLNNKGNCLPNLLKTAVPTIASEAKSIKSFNDFPAKIPFKTSLTSPYTVDISQLLPIVSEVIGFSKRENNLVPPQILSFKIGVNCNGLILES